MIMLPLPLLAAALLAVAVGCSANTTNLQQQLYAAEARVLAAEAEAAELRLRLLQEQQKVVAATKEEEQSLSDGDGHRQRNQIISHAAESVGGAPASTATRNPSSDMARQPVAFWASQPIRPGETMLVGVTHMSNTTQIELRQIPGDWIATSPVGVTSYGCAVAVPASFRYAPFEVRAGGTGGAAAPLAVNRPSPWFAFADQGERATPGGWVRIVGEAIGLSRPSTLVLRSRTSALSHELEARLTADGMGAAPSRWHAFYDLPPTISLGSWEVSLRAPSSGSDNTSETEEKLCTFISVNTTCLGTITVTEPKKWPSQQFIVKSRQPGIGRNATTGVLAALAAARANGGGVVYFPRGQYFIDVPLIVPQNTIIRGAGKDLVAINFAESTCPCDLVEMARLYRDNATKYGRNLTQCRNACTAPPAYVTSDSTTNKPDFHPSWGIESLSLYVTAYATNIVQFQPQSDGCFMRGVRVRYNSQFCHNPGDHGNPGRGGRTAQWNPGTGQVVTLAGRNLFVEDCDL